MKKISRIGLISLLVLNVSLIGSVATFFIHRQADIDQPTPRVTNILVTDDDGNSDVLRALHFSSISTMNGNVTLMTRPLRFGNSSGLMQWDVSESELVFSNDDGTTWQAVGSGSGSGVEYGLEDNGTGTMATANYAAAVLSPIFFLENWHWSAAMVLDTIPTCTLWELMSTDYSAVRLRIGIDASDQLYVTVGTDLGGTPGTTTYTYTAQALSATETGVPITIDVSYDGTGDEVIFRINGIAGSPLAATVDFDNATTGMTDAINLGSSIDGRLLFTAFGEGKALPGGIVKEGAYPSCGSQWNFDEGEGTTLGDVCGSFDLTCDENDWIEVEGGY